MLETSSFLTLTESPCLCLLLDPLVPLPDPDWIVVLLLAYWILSSASIGYTRRAEPCSSSSCLNHAFKSNLHFIKKLCPAIYTQSCTTDSFSFISTRAVQTH